MSDTFGDLVDKLTIANIRLWHIEDERREFSAKIASLPEYRDGEENAAKKDAEKAHSLLQMVAKVNKERNSLVDQINGALAVLVDQARNKDSRFELTAAELLGTGKNKFYKMEDHS